MSQSSEIFKPLFNVFGEGSSIHEEEGHYFVVDDDFREKIRNFFPIN